MNSVICVGDIHGEWDFLIQKISLNDITNSYLILLGDSGIGFCTHSKQLRILNYYNNFFAKRNIEVLLLRGNHENPVFWQQPLNFSKIKFVPDNSVVELNGRNFLFLGGAISIDRKWNSKNNKPRKIGTQYWEDEAFILNKELLSTVRNIDYVVSHSSPAFCFPQQKTGIQQYFDHDKNLENDCEKERTDLLEAYFILNKNNKIRQWLYGHFHINWFEDHFGTDFRALGICELYEIRY